MTTISALTVTVFETLSVGCPSCGTLMQDVGTLQEELGPYSASEENSLAHSQYGCAHQLFCENCAASFYYTVASFSCGTPPFDESIQHRDD
jgi:hypothetical protein